MTFSLLLHVPETGEFGAAIASSSPAVAARCVNLADGVGAATSQNVTDPRLGPAILAELAAGESARAALDAVIAETAPETLAFRQLLVIDSTGRTSAYSGTEALGVFGARTEPHAVAGGNMLADLTVLDALIEASLAATGPIEERLFAGLTAAVEAGGEAGPIHSAGLSVVRDAGWRVTDLRVDWADDDPIDELGRLLRIWLPQRDAYITRGLSPAASPSYGVPGDLR